MQSPLFGGFGGTAFDDRVESLTFEGITALTIRHGRNIDAIQATYKLPDGGSYTTPQRGGGGGTATTIHFEEGEKIVRISGKSGPSKLIDMLRILTQTALGELKQYGPYGTGLPGPSDFTVTGAVSGLLGAMVISWMLWDFTSWIRCLHTLGNLCIPRLRSSAERVASHLMMDCHPRGGLRS